ncbi:transglutaminase family protein [Nakamurella silvestris]|nr:transglutaminase family protein [Nakamurella silvestris]
MERRNIRIGCDFVYVADIPTPTVFQVQPRQDPDIVVSGEQWVFDPATEMHRYTDLYGNGCARVVLPAGRSTFHYEAVADVPDAPEEVDVDAPEIAPQDLPDETLIYTVPSRYCLPDVLGRQAWARFEDVAPGYGRVAAICDYVHRSLQFQYGTSTAQSTSADVFLAGQGVCRDFAHLAITFCRALNIPARYAFGYLPFLDMPSDGAPADFAAWIEVWLGDRWWTFDPRNNELRKGRVVIGRGRDAADVAMATTFGGPWLESMVVYADEVGRP